MAAGHQYPVRTGRQRLPGLLDWLEINEPETALSVISLGEIALGIERLPEGKRRRALERAFHFLRQDYNGKILDFTEGVAIEWARLVTGRGEQDTFCLSSTARLKPPPPISD